MEFRFLGRSGLKISAITYGNWLTHGSQVENDVARACVAAALDAGITSPYAHLREYVASRTLTESPDPHVEIIAQDLVGRVRELKAEDGELGIWLCGGSQLAGELLDEIDELVIKTYPQVYGSGMPMFGAGFSVTDFTLESVRTFGNGALVRTYARRR